MTHRTGAGTERTRTERTRAERTSADRTSADRTPVAVLGTGAMGAPIARSLLRAGFEVTVWNRTRQKTGALTGRGAKVAGSPAAAAARAEYLITMLTDGAAVESAMTGADGALAALAPDAVWIQMSTVGVTATLRLAELARGAVGFVDAPVSGSSGPADRGQLLVLASGDPGLRLRVQPLFDELGRRTLWFDRLGDGSRFKTVLNNWLAVLVEGMAETLSLAGALRLDPGLVLDTLAESPLGSAYATAKGRAMVERDFAPGFPLRHAGKDAALALSAADHRELELPLTEALLKRWDEAISAGHAEDDVASAVTVAGHPRP
ncbi:NAD(P)-dependent oxidoreductase [Streptomyces sp900105755]|uniref:NAD(P)-dependent oxidoreductase n=1 Tax=Streptomyces sp. 900105755 TaxID=3154389 RepID=A0ABV1TTR9_9ACTN